MYRLRNVMKAGNIKKMILKTKKLTLLIFINLLIILNFYNNALAATCADGDARACLGSPDSKQGQIMELLNIGINFLAISVGIVATIMLIISGIQYTTSNGDPQKVTKAKQQIVRVISGLLAFVFLYALMQWLIPGGIF